MIIKLLPCEDYLTSLRFVTEALGRNSKCTWMEHCLNQDRLCCSKEEKPDYDWLRLGIFLSSSRYVFIIGQQVGPAPGGHSETQAARVATILNFPIHCGRNEDSSK